MALVIHAESIMVVSLPRKQKRTSYVEKWDTRGGIALHRGMLQLMVDLVICAGNWDTLHAVVPCGGMLL